tara:strand:- start:10283 stop:11833 length:1551 start_codon:yes stop_codon:yes gene_type:complete
MNIVLKGHNDKMNRLVNVSKKRRSKELNFFTDASNKYRGYMSSSSSENPYEDNTLANIIKDYFIDLAQRPVEGVIARQTKLNLEVKNLGQKEIKEDKKFIKEYFSRLDKCITLGGYLAQAIDTTSPQNLPSFISNYRSININGTNERDKDKNMFSMAAWSNLFDYYRDVKVDKNFYFRETASEELVVFTQSIEFLVKGETFRKYLHNVPYVMDDFLKKRNIKYDQHGNMFYIVYNEIDSSQLDNDELLSLFISQVPEAMDLQATFEQAGITKNATLQPQFFLGGTIPSEDPNDVAEDTSIKIPIYSVNENKVKKYLVKPIVTEFIDNNPAYNAEVRAHIAGLFAVASGNISVLSGYSNKRLGIDLPLGINEEVTPGLIKLYDNMDPEGKAGFVGNRYAFNKTGYGDQAVALVDAQRAYMMSTVLQSNLDRKLPQSNIANEPSIIKETLSDEKKQGKDLIKALNDNEMPIPEFYRNMLGIKEWQAGMTLFYQKLPEEVRDLPMEQSPEIVEFVEQYS